MGAPKNPDNLSIIVGKNIKDLRIQAGLTMDGLAFALSISISYVLMIERGAANISAKLAKKAAAFFGVDVSQLYSSKLIKLKPLNNIASIATFYKENDKNVKFFIHRKSEYSTAAFIRNVLLSDPFLTEEHDIGEIKAYCFDKYQRELSSEELSREIRRLYLKKILQRRDKFQNGSVYLYSLKLKEEP